MKKKTKPPTSISRQEWHLAREIRDDIKMVVESIKTPHPADDKIQQYLRVWHVGLGVLVHEYLDTVIDLSKSPSRVALIIPRFILEAALRLQMLIDDAAKVNTEGKPAEEAIAVRDFDAALKRNDKIFRNLGYDLSSLTEAEQNEYSQMVENAPDDKTRRMAQLYKLVPKDSISAIEGNYSLMSSYVHANELAVSEASRGDGKTPIIPRWRSEVISRRKPIFDAMKYSAQFLSILTMLKPHPFNREYEHKYDERIKALEYTYIEYAKKD